MAYRWNVRTDVARWGRRTHARERSADGPTGRTDGLSGMASVCETRCTEALLEATPCASYKRVI